MNDSIALAGIGVAQRLAPDPAVRWGMRQAISRRLDKEASRPPIQRQTWLDEWHRGPIALSTGRANAQHYEVETRLFETMLGPRLKYSSCLWDTATNLAGAEDAMLATTVEGSGIEDGMAILDMGCGWGSLSGYIAERFPACDVTAISNSATQGGYISERYPSVRHVVADINDFDAEARFDRVVSVEMVEHLRNHPALFGRVRGWLEPGGSVFIHHFSHRRWFWPFENEGVGDWMARRFFTGGIMPSHDLLPSVVEDWKVTEHRWFDGRHYSATLEAWLRRLDAEPRRLVGDFDDWRWFLMACSELFAQGTEFGVTHVGLKPS